MLNPPSAPTNGGSAIRRPRPHGGSGGAQHASAIVRLGAGTWKQCPWPPGFVAGWVAGGRSQAHTGSRCWPRDRGELVQVNRDVVMTQGVRVVDRRGSELVLPARARARARGTTPGQREEDGKAMNHLHNAVMRDKRNKMLRAPTCGLTS